MHMTMRQPLYRKFKRTDNIKYEADQIIITQKSLDTKYQTYKSRAQDFYLKLLKLMSVSNYKSLEIIDVYFI